LQVRYHATRQVDVTVRVVIDGDIGTAWDALKPGASPAECRDWITQALDRGHLTLSRSGSDMAPETLWQQAEEQALGQGASQLRRYLQSKGGEMEQAGLSVQVELSSSISIPSVLVTDVGDWFSGNEGDDHINVVDP
jgi:hypothetical protein